MNTGQILSNFSLCRFSSFGGLIVRRSLFLLGLPHSVIHRAGSAPIIAPCLLIFLALQTNYSAAVAQDPKSAFMSASTDLVQSVIEEGTRAIDTTRTTADQTGVQFSSIFSDNFSTDSIGLRLLGRYWDAAADDERTDFLTAFGLYLADRLVGGFPQGNFTFFEPKEIRQNTRPRRLRVTVPTVFASPNSSTVINWSVEQIDGRPAIYDISFRQSSLIERKHDEYARILDRNDGSIRGLIAVMQN